MSRRGRISHCVACPTADEPLASWAAMAVATVAALAENVVITVEGRAFRLAPLDLLLVQGGCGSLATSGHALIIGFTAETA